MGGISKYQQAFFVPEFSKQHPQFADHVYRLKSLTLDQVSNCDPCLSVEVSAVLRLRSLFLTQIVQMSGSNSLLKQYHMPEE
jgi:hypothetical protein